MSNSKAAEEVERERGKHCRIGGSARHSRSLPGCAFLLMPGFTSIDASQKGTSAISTHGSTRQRSSSTNASERHSVKRMASTGGAKGIPDTNRAECAAALEPDPEPVCRALLLHDFGTPKRRL